MDQQLVAKYLTSDSDEIADIKLVYNRDELKEQIDRIITANIFRMYFNIWKEAKNIYPEIFKKGNNKK